MVVSPGVEDIHQMLLDRILAGIYPPGSKLPSCRALATELGSNSSTVDRAIAQLVSAGRVRTLPRRGSFVTDADGTPSDPVSIVAVQAEELLRRARRIGLTSAQVAEVVRAALDRVDSMHRIAVVECNERDLRNVQELVQRASDVEVQPVLLEEIDERRLDEEFDAVAVPIFHLNDVADLISDPERVIELNLVPSRAVLRQIVDARQAERIVVVAPSARGITWMTALVGQYYPGQIDAVEVGRDVIADLDGAPVVVTNNAAALPDGIADRVGQLIAVEWELDSRFVAALRDRVEYSVRQRRQAQGGTS
ncbi:GntR family transcriptional regulator [uncultured Aeromicrobium sp.]|uniref:GntR family transcriptional regulator n=1 Tax=uncultured Aeromicrobium sp. TaxID=337820 RepID=UPI0025E7A7FA|nr:GntR family transcriptional regulator [uncultured Aeromicrobium sp.]